MFNIYNIIYNIHTYVSTIRVTFFPLKTEKLKRASLAVNVLDKIINVVIYTYKICTKSVQNLYLKEVQTDGLCIYKDKKKTLKS